MSTINKNKKRIFETKLRLKMYHIQKKKTASIWTIPHVYSDLSQQPPSFHKKSEIG